MPRRGRHRTRLPFRLLAAVAALLVGGTAVVLGGSALAQDEGGDSGGGSFLSSLVGSSKSDDSGDSDDSDSDSEDSDSGEDRSGEDKSGEDESGDDGQDQDQGQDGDDGQDQGKDGEEQSPDESKKTDDQKKDDQDKQAKGEKADPFPGRDEIAKAGADRYVDITEVSKNGNIGDGGTFTGNGSYSVDCGVSDHNNPDNFMAAPGKQNGAQHVHDYVGNTTTDANSTEESLEAGKTSCQNGEKSTFFWPVLRDLNGTGEDEGENGGSLDGNVGSILTPASAQLTFRGHGDLDEMSAMPEHLMIIMGNAKAKAQDGKNANAKYTCTGFEDRVTDKYPICPSGSQLVRILDYPSCWDGQNLQSKDLRSHTAFPDESGNCAEGFTSIPALRITLKYDQPAGRAFAIDSFPDNQHDPTTDHSDFMSYASKAIAEKGLDCIRKGETCINVTG
ncbi:DUF1996 domain-containing protein [Actinomycetospora sp. OC33-EN08]|uniref:DUF1996 domain-containing protein n=1 Tax=Actinomycetospora aurantiaca TaxID=3129233 RepID=A0ABU8MSL8_9PSEU